MKEEGNVQVGSHAHTFDEMKGCEDEDDEHENGREGTHEKQKKEGVKEWKEERK